MFANAYVPRVEKIIIGVTLRNRIVVDAELLKKLSKHSTIGEVFEEAENRISGSKFASYSSIEIDYAITLYKRLKEARYNIYLASGKELVVGDKEGNAHYYPKLVVLYQLETGWFVADLSKIISSQTMDGSANIPIQVYMAQENIDKLDLYDPLRGYPDTCMHVNTAIMSKEWKKDSPVYTYKGDLHSLNTLAR